MNIHPTDLLLRKTNGTETVWISQRLLVEVCEVSELYIRKSRTIYKQSLRQCDIAKAGDFLPDSGKSWRWGKLHNEYYYAYDNIPDKAPNFYKSKLGTESQLKEALKQFEIRYKADIFQHVQEGMKQAVKQLVEHTDVRYYMYEAAVGHTKAQAQDLAKAKAWSLYIRNNYDNDGYKALGLATKQDFLHLCAEILQPMALYGLKVSNPNYLRRKVLEMPLQEGTEQLDYFISDKNANTNARKVGKYEIYDEETGEVFSFDAHMALMYNGYMSPGWTTKNAMRTLYMDYYVDGIQDVFGLEPIAYRTFCHHLSRISNQILTAKARHGEDYFKKHFLTYIPSKKLQYSHSLFAGDGSGTVSYQYAKTDSKGKTIINTMKLYVLVISDVASRKIVGWAPAPVGLHKETPEMLEQALKMAINTCDKMTMFEFISDNHGAFTAKESKELLGMVFNKFRTIESGNSQANPAETEFRLFKKFLKNELNFISSSWKTSIEGQSNPDHLSIDQLPSYEDAIIQFYDIVERYNATPMRDGVTPNERFANRNPNALPMDSRVLRNIYGNHTKVDTTYMRGFVKVSKTKGYEERTDYLFEINDYEGMGAELISEAIGHKKRGEVQVIWDEEAADIYTLEGKFVMTCHRTALASQSYIEATGDNWRGFHHHKERKAKITEKANQLEQELLSLEDDLPYIHQMKLGGNKETYNKAMDENTKPEVLRKKRNDRDFDDDLWAE